MRNKWPVALWFLICPSLVVAQVPTLRSLLSDPAAIYKEGEPWTATPYSLQKKALGLEESAFEVPANLKSPYSFWVRVYTGIDTSQGLIHDTENLDIVYETIDFATINKTDSMSEEEKDDARESLVENRKKLILESLEKIAAGESESSFTTFDKAIWSLWKERGGREAVTSAADLSRLRFQLGQSDRMKEAIFLSGRYLPVMEKIFHREGLPLQLTRLPFVESSFNVFARSKVGASGLWQIMRSASRGRLKVNREVDQRNDPEKATEMAAKILRSNFQMLGAWPLAITGYNHGPSGVRRLVEKNHTRDLGELIKVGESRSFGFASRNFYASFLAALEVEGHADQYFPKIRKAQPLRGVKLALEKPILFSSLVKAFHGNRDLAQLYNPHLQKQVYADHVKLDSKVNLWIPMDEKEIISKLKSETSESKEKPEKISLSKARKGQAFARKSEHKGNAATDDTAKKYRVSKGDTLYRISRRFRVSVKDLLASNSMKGPHSLRVGQVLQIP